MDEEEIHLTFELDFSQAAYCSIDYLRNYTCIQLPISPQMIEKIHKSVFELRSQMFQKLCVCMYICSVYRYRDSFLPCNATGTPEQISQTDTLIQMS